MKNVVRIISASMLLCICISFISFAKTEGLSPSGGSIKGITWKYYTGEDDERGYPLYLKSEWKEFEKGWCYFDEEGLTTPGDWMEIDGKWYYFDESSIMLHDTTTPDGYYVGSDGAWDQNEPVAVQ